MQRLTLEDVAVRFGRIEALRGTSLELRAGEVFLLAGPNGAGKSTLIRVLLGLVAPTRGTLRVDGAPVRADRAFRARLGYLPESVAFSESSTGREVVSFFAAARGAPEKRIDEVLERVGLADARSRLVRGYSRGMRQRLGLAVALVAPCELLVLDEPTGGLDQDALTLLWSVLDEHRAAGCVVLLASHEIALLESRVDRLGLLARGQLVALGDPTSLRERAALPVRVKVAPRADADRDALVQALERVGTIAPVRGARALELDVKPSRLLELLDLDAAHRACIADLQIVPPPFDEVYRRLLSEAA